MIISLSFYELACCVEGCGVEFAITQGFERQRRKDHAWFYCPNGHHQHFPAQTREEKLQAEKLQLESRLEFTQKRLESVKQERDAETRRTRTQKARATRFKNERDRIRARIANGVCPCCNRSFQNVLRHMASKHSTFVVPSANE